MPAHPAFTRRLNNARAKLPIGTDLVQNFLDLIKYLLLGRYHAAHPAMEVNRPLAIDRQPHVFDHLA